MNTFLQICGGIGGLVLLYYGADGLVRGSVAVATKMKIPPLVIGLTLVAFGTSAPELVVSIGASLNGHGDVSIGNVVGSNICNIALILGVCAMITPLNVNPKLFKLDVPLMLLSSIVLGVFCYFTGGVNRWESLVFLTGIILYTSWSLFASKRDGEQPQETDENAGGDMRLPLALLLAIAGLFCLICGGKLLVNSAVSIAKKILEEGGADDYLRFLSTGGSDYPLEELKIAGVDLTKPDTVANALKVFDETLTELEELLAD